MYREQVRGTYVIGYVFCVVCSMLMVGDYCRVIVVRYYSESHEVQSGHNASDCLQPRFVKLVHLATMGHFIFP